MGRLATFTLMLAFWAVMSGMFDAFHFGLGLVCCLALALSAHRSLFPAGAVVPRPRQWGAILLYPLWLLKEIFVSSVQVSFLVLHPRMLDLIDPQLIRFRTRLQRPFSRVTFAQSITLTPGTITATVIDDEFTVYALTRGAAEALPGEMERRVARALEPEVGA